MPLIQVTMIEGRTAEQKRQLLEALTRAVSETIGAPLDSIRAWITDVPPEQFMSAGALASDRAGAAPAASLPPPPDASPGAPPAPPVDPILAPGGPSQPL